MIDLNNPQMHDFQHIEASHGNAIKELPLHSYFKAKPGTYTIPRTEHKITKLPEGIL